MVLVSGQTDSELLKNQKMCSNLPIIGYVGYMYSQHHAYGLAAIRWGKRQSDIQNRYTPQMYGGTATVTTGNSVDTENEKDRL
jgi:hypothetical protein